MQANYKSICVSPHLVILVPIGGMPICVWMQMGKSITLIVKPSHTIESIKDKIHEMEGIHPDSQRLMYYEKELNNGCTLFDYNIKEDSVIYCVPVDIKCKYLLICVVSVSSIAWALKF